MIADTTMLGIIVLLIAAHYASMIYEIRALKKTVSDLQTQMTNILIMVERRTRSRDSTYD